MRVGAGLKGLSAATRSMRYREAGPMTDDGKASGLLSVCNNLERRDVEHFLGEDRIVHVYGKVHHAIPTKVDAIDLATAEGLGD